MKILLTGATGFVGRALVPRLLTAGHDCVVLSRRPNAGARRLPPTVHMLSYDDVWPAADAVINLAGETIAGWWTPDKRRRIMNSRLQITRRLVAWMATASPRPRTLLSMSAVGIYGHRPGEIITEASSPDPAQAFRARVCRAWEAEARAAGRYGVRVVTLRLGNVLHPAGGYLGALLALYRRLPVVGLAPARTCFSWVSRRDAVRMVRFALENDVPQGPLNVTAPRSVSQGVFTRALARRLGKRLWGRLPTWALRLGLGAFAATLLDSLDVRPAKARELGFRFDDPRLPPYLARVL
ncbi:MAG: TIGR01777 family oxidoreductase [Candidatus Promineifilaceae bacterium]|nr:TIGR01777 family oxidoreductase [Candidatus Promineifilaceae bacterium]